MHLVQAVFFHRFTGTLEFETGSTVPARCVGQHVQFKRDMSGTTEPYTSPNGTS